MAAVSVWDLRGSGGLRGERLDRAAHEVDEAAQLHATGKALKPSSSSSLDVPIKKEIEA